MKITPHIRYLVLIVTMTTLAGFAQAHEFWIKPDAQVVPEGALLGLTLMHGERFIGQPVARNSPMIMRYQLVSQGHNPVPVAGMHGSVPGYLRPQRSGAVVYQTRHYRNDLPAEQFEAYLAEEGLSKITDMRREAGESDSPGREIYSRCAKSIILVEGDERDASEVDHDTGLPLEIMIKRIEKEKESIRVTAGVEFLDKPVAGMRVVAVHSSNPDQLIELKTDELGRVAFDAAPGDWMLTTLHIRRAELAEDADWESFWASSTFSVQP